MKASDLVLAPVPKRIVSRPGVCKLHNKQYIRLDADEPQLIINAARKTGVSWEITASPNAPYNEIGLIIELNKKSKIRSEGYKLTIDEENMKITASDPAGAFYGACTIAQIIRQCDKEIPCLCISDFPDFGVRGLMLDISRDKVPTMETLYSLVDQLAEWKINHFELYTEHTFRYLAHPEVWKDASPMTGEQIMDLDAYCKAQHIELVPNQNSFGHMERWLKIDRYKDMAEDPNGCQTVWGFRPPSGLSPASKQSIPFVKGLFDELLPHFTSSLFNVGCDETIDLGCGQSKEMCEKQGTGKVYLDFLLKIYKLVKSHNKTMMFWGDIIMHYPELISKLPKDIIALEWGYEAKHPFAEHGAKFRESGIPFYVCPGTSSWNSLVGRTDNAIDNINNAAKNGLKQGAIGLLNTDWGDNGHWQNISVSRLGFLAGAMASWNTKTDIRKKLANSLSLHAFHDKSMKTGEFFYQLGNLYTLFQYRLGNSSIPWTVLFRPMDRARANECIKADELDAMENKVLELEAMIADDEMKCKDAEIVHAEIAHLLNMMKLAVKVGRARIAGSPINNLSNELEQVKCDHQKVWLMRNREGGMIDSTEKIVSE
jgi:hexosaminidase